MILLFVLLVALGIVRGVIEGMVMTQVGVRDHRWFINHYHRLTLLRDFIFLLSGITLYRIQDSLINIEGLFFIAGVLIFSWECFELCYSYSRYKKWIPDSENVLGLGINVTIIEVLLMHTARVIVSILFLIMWRLS